MDATSVQSVGSGERPRHARVRAQAPAGTGSVQMPCGDAPWPETRGNTPVVKRAVLVLMAAVKKLQLETSFRFARWQPGNRWGSGRPARRPPLSRPLGPAPRECRSGPPLLRQDERLVAWGWRAGTGTAGPNLTLQHERRRRLLLPS